MRRSLLANLGAVSAFIAATSCCLPLLPFVAAAGVAGSSTVLATLRPYLLALSVALVAYGFYEARRARQCRAEQSILRAVLLWSSAAFVVGATAWYLYGGGATPKGQPTLVRLNPGNFSEFLQDFNAAAEEVRVVAMLSPT